MPEIQADALVEGRTPDEVWEVVKDSAKVGAQARDVVSVRDKSSQDKLFRINEWTVLLNGSEVTWVQREAAGPGLRLRFEQTAGDLERLAGEWSVTATPDGAKVSVALDFDLGVDGLAPLLEPMWSQSFQAHAEDMLRAVATLAA